MYLVVALKPKLEPLVNKKGLKWSDILPALNSISSVEALESAVSDPETFLAKLAKASGRAGQKYLVATLRPRLEPLMRKQKLKNALRTKTRMLSRLRLTRLGWTLNQSTRHPLRTPYFWCSNIFLPSPPNDDFVGFHVPTYTSLMCPSPSPLPHILSVPPDPSP